MLIERVQALETELTETRKEVALLQAERRTSIIMNIAGLQEKQGVCFDVFAYLLGVPPETMRNMRSSSKYDLAQVLKTMPLTNRVRELAAMLHCKPFWELTDVDFEPYGGWLNDVNFASNMYQVLEAMTLEELEGYWKFRLQWTNWKP